MENKFDLSHVVLYAKGWYLNTGNVFEDLKKILEFDGYTPFSNMDVYSILLNSVQNSNIYRWTSLVETLNGIHPKNCWKYGYYTKGNYFWAKQSDAELPEYDMQTAFIYYTLSNLTHLENTNWNVKTPKLSKYPRGKNITIRKVYETFVLNKLKIKIIKT